MKTFLALLLFALLDLFMYSYWEDAAKESPRPATPIEHKTVKAEFHAGAATLRITNLGGANWPVLNVFINGDPPFAFRCVIDSLAPGASITIPLTEFAKDKTGERFNPHAYKLTKVCIGGNGFDYEAYGF